MSSGLRKSTKSGFIAPLLPTTMENNNMDMDSFDTPNSYPITCQRQEDIHSLVNSVVSEMHINSNIDKITH